MIADLHFTNHSIFWLIEPRTDAAKTWVANRIPAGATRWGNGVAIPLDFLEYIVIGAVDDGLICENPAYSDDESTPKMSEVSTSTRSKVTCRDAAAIIRNLRAYYGREMTRNAAKTGGSRGRRLSTPAAGH